MTLLPWTRLIILVLGVTGALLTREHYALLAAWSTLLAGVIAAGIGRAHLLYVLLVLLPLGLALAAVWGWLVGAPPHEAVGSNPSGGLAFALLIVLRLAVVGGLIQLCIGTLSQVEVPHVFRAWGLSREATAVAMGVLAIGPEIKMRTQQVLDARIARGLYRPSSLWSRLTQMPFLLRPLFVWSIRSAVDRASVWDERQLVERIEHLPQEAPAHAAGNAIATILAVSWLSYAVWSRFL